MAWGALQQNMGLDENVGKLSGRDCDIPNRGDPIRLDWYCVLCRRVLRPILGVY